MVADKIRELETARAKLAALEQSITAELNQELAALPARYGFSDTAAFLAAVKTATGGASNGKRGRRKAVAAPGTPAPRKRRKRAKITDAMRGEVKKLVEQGKTGTEIAKSVGISLPSVQNIKTALGLVKKKK